mgnify:FL=1|jgi:hypothetical protein|tara:strand:+ start:66 stop:215 length:150 start_codon:yes stop_codon:yes gene_type:complete
MKIDWINSWGSGNKKEKYELSFRLGTLTVLEISFGKEFRFMILNFGFKV